MTTDQKIEKLEKELHELKAEVAAQNQPKFKKGDFVYGEYRDYNQKFVFIFDETINSTSSYDKAALFFNSGTIFFVSGTIRHDTTRLATEAEKQQLIDKLHENGKDLDAEKCEIVDYRWRAKNGEAYYLVYSTDLTIFDSTESGDEYDDERFELGNYFKTKELAEAAAEKVKQLLLTLKHS